MALSPIVEFLLGYRSKEGKPLCSFGAVSAIVWYPANFTTTYDSYPAGNAFANIIYAYRETPSLVPESIQQDSWGDGLELALGPMTTVIMSSDPSPTFYIRRQDNPTHITITNRTNLIEREDYGQAFLIIYNETDYKFVLSLIRDWCSNYRVPMEMEQMNLTLKAIAEQGGVVVPEAPRPSIIGGS